jgi:hypothetical protein
VTPGVSRAGKHVAAAIVIAMLSMTAFVFAAPAASAANTTKFCAANTKLQAKLDSLGNGKFNASSYKGAGSAFKSAAKSAPAKVKKAMGTIGSFLSTIGSGSPTDFAKSFTGSAAQKYEKAVGTWTTYVATNCS